MLGGFVIVIWILCPILWGMSISASSESPLDLCLHSVIAKNVFYSHFMPVSVGTAFDNTGLPYNLSAVVTNNVFDQSKYEQYSPMFLPITYAVTYGTIFAIYPAIMVHTFLWYRHDIVRQFRRSLNDETDIHSYLMRRYRDVPHWWFIVFGTACVVLGIISIEICKTGLPYLGVFPRARLRVVILASVRHYTSYYKPTVLPIRSGGGPYRICTARTSDCCNALQDAGQRHCRTGSYVLQRLEIRTLHEDPTTPHLYESGPLLDGCGHCFNCGTGMGSGQHP